MKRLGFHEFIDKKSRDGRRHLNIIRDVLQKGGLQVGDFVEHNEDDPFLFVRNPEKDSGFHGIRIYNIGSGLAFRIQREEKTHPYGTAYSLKVPDMFADLVEDMSQEEAGKKVIENLVKEVKKFFVLSARAESEDGDFDITTSGDPMGKMVLGSSGMDVTRGAGVY